MLVLPNGGIPAQTAVTAAQDSKWESTAWEYWFFDQGGTGNYSGRVNGRALTEVGASPITHNALSITTNATAGKGLISGLSDRQTFTAVATVKWQNALFYVFGAYPSSTSGSALLLSASSANEGRRDARGVTPTNLNVNATVDPADNLWVFVAMSVSLTGTSNVERYLFGGFHEEEVTSTTGSITTDGTKFFGIGSPYSGCQNAYEIASFGLWDGLLTMAQMRSIFERERARHREVGRELVA